MAKSQGIYKCLICGNVVSVLDAGRGELVCCGKPMSLFEEKTAEQEGREKHVPLLEPIDGGIKVTVGSVLHPMEEKHYIELIQLIKEGEVFMEKRLKPGTQPIAEFCHVNVNAEGLMARAFCNLHGLWKN
ncbi:MAG: desulfoferrodoxin [bacterium]